MNLGSRIFRGVSDSRRRQSGPSGPLWSPSPSTVRMVITAIVLLALLAFVYLTSTFWVQWWWFESVGYQTALTTRYVSAALAFIVAGLLGGGFFALNWWLALRRTRDSSRGGRIAASPILRVPLVGVSLAVGVFVGWIASEQWDTWRLAFAGNSFGVSDRVFGLDASFYVFLLPALDLAHSIALGVTLVTLVAVALLYLGQRGLDRLDQLQATPQARRHLLVLAALALILFGARYLLANFELQYSTRGFVYGPGYTDVTVTRPLNYLLAVVSMAAAVVLLFGRRSERLRWLTFVFLAWAIAVALGAIIPQVVQQTVVKPNELQREAPYIANNIALTRIGFGLDSVEGRNLSGQGEPPASALQSDSPVLGNVRLWDYRIARETYQQLQSFVSYYVFNDVDVDRYPEEDELQQVLVSARELDLSGLQANVQNWTNQHLVYTHGYAAVVSPINEATSQGLPVFSVSGIPPNPAGAQTIEQPGIYFGERDDTWVAVNTRTQEVNGINGDTPSPEYSGLARGSISLDNYLRRVMLSINLSDRTILFTDQFTSESRVLLNRAIQDRVSSIAPFLEFDSDPYLTIVDGRLIWILDAYTATDRFPNSTPAGGINYIRHSVKATVDAYDGTVTFYRTATPDPIADAYSELFRDMFRPISEAPPALAEHFRYPEGMYDLQTEVFAAYHVTDPTVFYNGDDRWQVAAEEVEGSSDRDTTLLPMESYYMTLPLPGETETGFKIIRPFTPINRLNMTAWMAGQSDEAGATRLVIYRFPRQTTVFGPQQVDARINQDPDISTQFTLLNQSGSRVISGNLLVIPIEQTVLYVQPVYLRATGSGGSPTELTFVIVATSDRVVMRPTLEEALAALAEADETGGAPGANVEGSPQSSTTSRAATAADALAAYQRGQTALRNGDWATYGEAQAELERVLQALAGAAPGPGSGAVAIGATPVAPLAP